MEGNNWKEVLIVSIISTIVSFICVGFLNEGFLLSISCIVFLFSLLLIVISLIGIIENKIRVAIRGEKPVNEIKASNNMSEAAKIELKQIEEKYNVAELDERLNSLNNENNRLYNEINTLTQIQTDSANKIKSFEQEFTSNLYDIRIKHIDKTVTYKNDTIKLDEILDIEISCNSRVISTTNSSTTTTGNNVTKSKGKEKRSLVSMAARGAVGTVLLGPVGGIAGMASAPKKSKGKSVTTVNTNNRTTTTTTDRQVNNYTVLIHTTRIENSIINIPCGESEVKAKSIVNGILNSINYPKEITEETINEYNETVALNNETSTKIDATNASIKQIKNDIKTSNRERRNLVAKKNKEIYNLNKRVKKGLI